MRTLSYAGIFKQALLMDELLAAFPDWLIGEGENRRCLLTILGNERGVRLIVPDDADEQAIKAVVDAHDPNALSIAEQAEAERAEVEAKATEARALWDGYEALKDKTPQEIFTIMQARMDKWATLADAQRDLRKWLPRMAALIAWGMRK